MAVSANSVVVGQGGTILWGTTGIAMPATGVAALTGFNDFGYLNEDGLTVGVTPTVQELQVWQSVQPVRRTFQTQAISISGVFAEFNVNTVPKAFGGGSLANVGTAVGGGTYAFPDPANGLDEFATVADVVDGTDKVRFSFARVNQTEASEVQFNRQNLAGIPFSFGVLAPQAGGSPGTIFVAASS